MKRLLKYVASAGTLLGPFAAHSTDLAVKAAPPPVFSWTGFYIGAKYWLRLGQQQLDGHALPDEPQQQQRRIRIVAA